MSPHAELQRIQEEEVALQLQKQQIQQKEMALLQRKNQLLAILETQQQPPMMHQTPMMHHTPMMQQPMMHATQAGGELNYLEREAMELSQRQHGSPYPSSSNSGQNICKDFLAGKCRR